jgi:four helix bundle protein
MAIQLMETRRMRDHSKLRAFQLADDLALFTYSLTRRFPQDERFGLTAQMRRAGVSTASNIVEGCGRRSPEDFRHFLDMAFGSLRELQYQASLAHRLGYFQKDEWESIDLKCTDTSKVLGALIRSMS